MNFYWLFIQLSMSYRLDIDNIPQFESFVQESMNLFQVFIFLDGAYSTNWYFRLISIFMQYFYNDFDKYIWLGTQMDSCWVWKNVWEIHLYGVFIKPSTDYRFIDSVHLSIIFLHLSFS